MQYPENFDDEMEQALAEADASEFATQEEIDALRHKWLGEGA